MFKIHEHVGTGRFFIIPPNELLSKNKSHCLEASLMGMSLVDYYTYLRKTYRSARLTVYKTFLSYSLSAADAKNLIGKLNKEYKRVK